MAHGNAGSHTHASSRGHKKCSPQRGGGMVGRQTGGIQFWSGEHRGAFRRSRFNVSWVRKLDSHSQKLIKLT